MIYHSSMASTICCSQFLGVTTTTIITVLLVARGEAPPKRDQQQIANNSLINRKIVPTIRTLRASFTIILLTANLQFAVHSKLVDYKDHTRLVPVA